MKAKDFFSRSFVANLHYLDFCELEIQIPYIGCAYVETSLLCLVQNKEKKETQSAVQKFLFVEGVLVCWNSFAAAYLLPFEAVCL